MSLESSLRDLTTSTIRIQPVAPPARTNEEMVKIVAWVIVGIPPVLALTSWFLMLAMGTLHDLFPSVASVGFWQAVTLILGLNTVAAIVRPRSFKWARR